VSGGSSESGMDGGTIVLQPNSTVFGATITVTNTNTGAVLGTTTSDSSGSFSLDVAVASNTVTAKKDGVTYATANLTEDSVTD
jgi:hypothetical protein